MLALEMVAVLEDGTVMLSKPSIYPPFRVFILWHMFVSIIAVL
jgi:hypothetical protein